MSNNGASNSQRDYWDSVVREVAALKDSALSNRSLTTRVRTTRP